MCCRLGLAVYDTSLLTAYCISGHIMFAIYWSFPSNFAKELLLSPLFPSRFGTIGTLGSSGVVMFLGLRRVYFSFSTCLLSLSHHVTNHPSISITWPITWLVTWPPTWPVTCHPSHLLLKVTCPTLVTCHPSHLLLKVTRPTSPAPKSPAHHLILPHLTSHDPIPTPDSFLFAYLSFASGFLARLLYFLHRLISRLILTPFSLPSRVSQFRSIWLYLLGYDSLLVQVLVVLCLSHTASSHVYKPSCFPRVGP